MNEKNETAQELAKFYLNTTRALINTYCQIKNNHPLRPVPKLARAIRHHKSLAYLWREIALELANKGAK